ncbi:MAG TPA: TerC family protein [Deinococcales bacterium]|nr:TerC family protein [Deinococcales bacterium]
METALQVPPVFWAGFFVFISIMLALDLGVFHRKSEAISVPEAARWTAVWVSLGLLFNGVVWYFFGSEAALTFLTGYVIEYSLSVDNIFVFVLLFSAFSVPAQYQHRVLFWGILGAVLMRGTLIFAGAALIERFGWLMYVFGAFLLFAGVRMFAGGNDDAERDMKDSAVFRFLSRILPVSDEYDGQRFFTRRNGRLLATPLFLVLIIVEVTDLVFAVDSIPAIFAITTEPFIVFTSNIFAILGLRSLYFLLAGIIHRFVYLQAGLAVILSYVGLKMLIADFVEIPTLLSLGVIAAVLLVSIVASVLRNRADGGGRAAR